MGSSVPKRSGLLTYPRASSLPMVPSREYWALCVVVKDQFWEIIDKHPLSASIPFKSTHEEDHHQYLTLFDDDSEGEEILISSSSFLRMRIENWELPWSDLMFKSKTDQPAIQPLVFEGDGSPLVNQEDKQAGVKKDLSYLRLLCWQGIIRTLNFSCRGGVVRVTSLWLHGGSSLLLSKGPARLTVLPIFGEANYLGLSLWMRIEWSRSI